MWFDEYTLSTFNIQRWKLSETDKEQNESGAIILSILQNDIRMKNTNHYLPCYSKKEVIILKINK